MKDIVIIGNGISGITAAINIRKISNHKITIISAETKYFYSRTALMYVYMGHMPFAQTQPYENDYWQKNNIELVQNFVETIDTNANQIVLKDGATITYTDLIVATGSVSNKFGWPGQDLKGVASLYHKQDLDYIDTCTKKCTTAVVVGGGLIGIELVEMLLSRKIKVTFLVRETSFWNMVLPAEESALINKHILEHNITLKLATGLKEIISDVNGAAKSVITDKDEVIDCDFVGLTVGVSPNIAMVKNTVIETNKGIKVNRLLQTNIANVYAIGDCAEQHQPIGNRRAIEAVWYTGRMMGETVAQTICGNPTEYKPGHWFNSAKFLDIEYQTYGWVMAQPKEDETHFYWQHKTDNKCVRIVYEIESRKFVGINTFGIRMRHDFFDNALTNNASVDTVIKNLDKANFDPEFFKKYESEISNQFLQQHTLA
jgi:NAD(P)H-nitrite reductase large subunit